MNVCDLTSYFVITVYYQSGKRNENDMNVLGMHRGMRNHYKILSEGTGETKA